MGIYALLGLGYAAQPLPEADIAAIRSALDSHYGLNPLPTLLPLAVMLGFALRRATPEVSMGSSILTAMAVAVLYQGDGFTGVLNSLWRNAPGTTGVANLDDLLGRGGMESMGWTLLLSLLALALGGILERAGFLRALLEGLVARIRRVPSLVASTIAAGFLGNMAMGEAYITIILNSQLFKGAFARRGLDPAVLSRSVEEGCTLTTGLIPWTTAGAFYLATLGVPVLDYAPYAFFNYLNAPISVALAALGWGLFRHDGGAGAGTPPEDTARSA
jgi:NhaC family Na+:H+ antiporter